jgi:hypothetical protein
MLRCKHVVNLKFHSETNHQKQAILERSLVAGGQTNRMVSKKMKNSYKKNPAGDADADEYPG